jgi:hypothetical protein
MNCASASGAISLRMDARDRSSVEGGLTDTDRSVTRLSPAASQSGRRTEQHHPKEMRWRRRESNPRTVPTSAHHSSPVRALRPNRMKPSAVERGTVGEREPGSWGRATPTPVRRMALSPRSWVKAQPTWLPPFGMATLRLTLDCACGSARNWNVQGPLTARWGGRERFPSHSPSEALPQSQREDGETNSLTLQRPQARPTSDSHPDAAKVQAWCADLCTSV